MFNTDPYEERMNNALVHFEDELRRIRTGRAHVGMLDGIKVEVYGTLLPLKQVANITAPEAQQLQITPFDPSTIQKIAAAIRDDQSLGLNPSDDGRVVRIAVPPLTEERRKLLVKQAAEKSEEARIAIRTVRQEGIKDAKRMKENKELSEDALTAVEKEFDRLVQDVQARIDTMLKAKEKEITTL